MPKPSVTCGANQTYAYSGTGRTISLTATATNSPTVYTWTLLDVPDGSTANVGANGDFVDGVSIIQNPSFNIEGAVEGSWVAQCIATNGDGDSIPTVDRGSGQTTITVRTQKYDLEYPGNKQYNWALSFFMNTLKKIEAAIYGNRSPLTTKGDVHVYGTASDRLPVGSNNQVLSADSAQPLGVKWATVATGSGQTNTVAGATGITNTGTNVDAVLTPTYGTVVDTICQGNDSRLVYFNYEGFSYTDGETVNSVVYFVLRESPASIVNSISGYSLAVFREGLEMLNVGSLTNGNYDEFMFDGIDTVSVKASGENASVRVMYWSETLYVPPSH